MSLIPHYLVNAYQNQCLSGSFEAIGLFLDLSGFTQLTEALMQHQKQGAEALTHGLNNTLTPIIEQIYAANGFVASFAGDAITALFPLEQPNSAPLALHATTDIQARFAKPQHYTTPWGSFKLTARGGLGIGEVQWGILQTANQTHATYYFRSQAIETATRAEQLAHRGQIVLDKAILPHLQSAPPLKPLSGASGYALLSGTPSEPIQVLQPTPITNKLLSRFLPASVLEFANSNIGGEFRLVLPVFISFQATEDNLPVFVDHLLQCAAEYDGYFNKLDFGDKGSIALVLFGAPIAHEDDAQRAAEFLLDLRQRCNPAEIPWRAGLARGMAYAGLIGCPLRSEYSAIGDTVNLSARLMQHANWGEILLDSQAAQSLAISHTLIPSGTHTIKGKRTPQATYALSVRHNQPIIPPFTGQWVGREQEMQTLQQFLDPIFTTTQSPTFAGLLTLCGESGIGKSRLLHELHIQVQAQGRSHLWLIAPCDPVLQRAFSPFIHLLQNYFSQSNTISDSDNKARFLQKMQELRAWLQNTPTPQLPATIRTALLRELERADSFLGALLNLHWPNSIYEQLEPRLRFENTLYSFKALLQAESLRQPVILVLEDTQWLDPASLQLLETIVRPPHLFPYAILSVCRPQDDGSLPIFSPNQEIPQETIRLSSLSTDQIQQMATDLLGAPIGQKLHTYLLEKTSGNPFLIEQILLDLQDRSGLQNQDGKLELNPATLPDIPTNLNAILIARLDRLSSEVKQTVQTAVVLGYEFEIAILSHMLNNNPLTLMLVTEAEKQAIWTVFQQIRCLFKHTLLRDAAYQMQFHGRLRILHMLALQAIETLYADRLQAHYEELAYHAQQAQQTEKQRLYNALAGKAAQIAYQNDNALTYYHRLLPLLNTPQETIPYLLNIAEIQERIGNASESARFYHRAIRLARQIDHLELLAQGQMQLGHLHHQRGQFDLARRWLKRALTCWQTLQNPAGICQTLSHISASYIRQSRYPLAEQIATQALTLARQTHNQSAAALALKNLGLIAAYQTHYDTAKEYYQQSLAFYREVDDKPGLSAILNNLGIIFVEEGHIAESRALFEESLTLDRQIGDKWGIGITLNNLGQGAEQMGEIETARLYYEESAAVCQEIGDQIGQAFAISNLAGIAMINNDLPLAHTLYSASLRIFQRSDDLHSTSIVLRNLAEIDLQLGKYSAAYQQLLESLTITQQLEDLRGTAYCILGLTRVLNRQALASNASSTTWQTLVRWIAAAQAIRAQNGFAFEDEIAQTISEILQTAQAQLTTADFQSANISGDQQTVEQIIAEIRTQPKIL